MGPANAHSGTRARKHNAHDSTSALSVAAFPALLSRVEKLGFTHSDLIKALAFVRDRAPTVVLGSGCINALCILGSSSGQQHELLCERVTVVQWIAADDRRRPAVHRS